MSKAAARKTEVEIPSFSERAQTSLPSWYRNSNTERIFFKRHHGQKEKEMPFYPSCTAHLFQPVAEVKESVAGVCERCVRCKYPQVLTVH